MSSLIRLIPTDEALAPLTLSNSGSGIWLDQGQESLFPVPQLNEAWAESPDTEGGKRISYQPQNPAGTGKVFIGGDTKAEFRSNVAKWQQYVYSANNYGAKVELEPDSGVAVTYEVRSMSITSLPQDGIWLSQGMGMSEFAITFAPYGSLAPIEVFKELETSQPVTAFDIGERAYELVIKGDEPSLYWRLGASGITDVSGHARNGTAEGGISIGASLGALTNDPDGATTFDGVNDRLTSSYAAFPTESPIRTMEGWAYRANTGENHTLFGGSGSANQPRVTIAAASQNVTYFSSGSIQWAGAWPGVNQWVHWAVILDGTVGANLVELFINGVSRGSREWPSKEFGLLFPATSGNFEVGAYGAGVSFFNGKQDEVAVFERRLSPERIFAHYLAGKYRVAVPGSAPATVDLTITEAQGTTRDHFEYGLDTNYDPENATPILIDAPTGVNTTSFAGLTASRAGAYSATGSENNVVRATLYTEPVALCSFSTEAIGKTRVKARIYGGSATAGYLRLAWRIGEAEFTYGEWQKLSNIAGFYELDLGVMNVPKAAVGAQSVEGWIEAYAASSGQSLDLDYLILMPLGAYGVASVEATTEQSAAPVMQDDGTTHSAGNLNGTSAPIGGVWTTVKLKTGEANFQVDGSHQIFYNATQAEGNFKNSLAFTATPAALGPVALAWDGWYNSTGGEYQASVGGVVRYVDSANYLAAYLSRINTTGGSGILQPFLTIIKAKNGYTTSIGSTIESAGFAQAAVWWSYKFAVDSAGLWSFQAGPKGGSLITYLTGQDADLAEGGKLATGHVGIAAYPYAPIVGTVTSVYFDNIVAFTLAPSKHVINANKSLELTSNALRKEPSTGSVWTPETLDGGYPKVPPNRTSRIVVKTRQYNVDSHNDASTWNGPIKAAGTATTAGALGTTVAEAKPAKPAAATQGTLMVATVGYGSSAAPHGVALVGYSSENLWSKAQGSYGLYTFYAVAAETDPEIFAIASGTTSTQESVAIVPYLGVDAGTSVNVSATASGTGTAVTAPSVTTTSKNCMIIVALGILGGASQPTVSGSGGMTSAGSRGDGTGSLHTSTSQWVDPSVQRSAGASGTRAFTLGSSSEWVAHTIALAPAKPLDGFSASLTITPRVQLVAN